MNIFITTLTCLLLLASPIHAQDKVALFIGNEAYPGPARLHNPVNDATGFRGKLEAAGYETFLVEDAGVLRMTTELERFYEAAKGAEVALFFYAGHGIEFEGLNYLLPVDAQLNLGDASGDALIAAKRATLKRETIALNSVLRDLGNTRAKLKLVVLDCCRNDPLPDRSWLSRDGSSGTLAEVGENAMAEGTMLVFSTAPGKRASDGAGQPNSPFTGAILQSLQPGTSILQVFTGAAGRMKQQEPWIKFDGSGRAMLGFGSYAMIPANAVVDAPVIPSMPVAPPVVTPSPPAFKLDRGTVGDSYEVDLGGGTKLTLQYIPPGEFMMGSPASEPNRAYFENQTKVELSSGFWMAKTECTQEQWLTLMDSNPSVFQGSSLPVENVSWEDVQQFIAMLNTKVPLPADWYWALPTEAQWEYACRSGTSTAFSFGGDPSALDRYGNFADKNFTVGSWRDLTQNDGMDTTAPVMSYESNAYSLNDMHGNVQEWCGDWFVEELSGGTDPKGPINGSLRVYRGGSWLSRALDCRSASRGWDDPTFRNGYLGFRLVAVQTAAK